VNKLKNAKKQSPESVNTLRAFGLDEYLRPFIIELCALI
jgi:hypothetical protein